MSWDIFAARFPEEAATPDDLGSDLVLPTIGSRSETIAAIQAVCPIADFTDPSWGKIEVPGQFSMEIALGKEEDPVTMVSFFVRGGGPAAGLVAAILQRLGLRGIDTGTAGFLDPSNPSLGFEGWQQYRDEVLRRADEHKQ